jgi:hypothetical protein
MVEIDVEGHHGQPPPHRDLAGRKQRDLLAADSGRPA